VEYVCETPDALDCLEQLREYSLVLTEEAGEETRYRTLESVREYACTLLSSEEGTALSRKHAAYFTILAERAAPELRGQSQASWLRGLEAERENIGAALDWLLASRDIEGGLRLASALARFWNMHGYSREGRQRLAALLAGARDLDSAGARTQAVSPAILAAAIDAAGTLAHDLGEYQEARRLHEEGLAIRRRLGDLKGVSASLHNLGTVSVAEGDYSVAQAFLEESLAIRRERDDRVGIAAALGHLGYVAHCQGDVLTAERRLQESVAISRELGDRWGMAGSLYLLGHLALSRGEEETAGRLFHEELAIERELGDPQGIAGALHSLGSVLRRQAAYEAASALYEESLAIQRGLGDQPGVATSLCSLGQVALSQGNLDAAKSLLEEALGLWRSLGARRGIAWATELLGEVAREQGELESASALLAESLKTRRELGDRTGVLVSVEALAKVASARDEPERATRLFGATASWRAARGTALPPNEQPDRDARLLALRKALGESAFDAAWCAGGALTEDEAIADALGPDPGRAAPVPDPADRDLTDVQWELLRPLLPPRAKEGRPRAEDRQTLNGILYVLRTGCRWQDMPPRYGSPVTCWRRLTQWRASGTWDRLALALLESLAPASREEWSRVLQR
jgi:transposase/tetratricopeptide (TPR) repeat protein